MSKYSKLSANSLEFVNNNIVKTKFFINDEGYVDLSGILIGDISVNNSVSIEKLNSLKNRFNLNQSRLNSLIQEYNDVYAWLVSQGYYQT